MISSTPLPTPLVTMKAGAPVKPKRPLSAFNLFYRFKRTKILAAMSADTNKDTVDQDAIAALVKAAPGTEDITPAEQRSGITSPDALNALRRKYIRAELESNLLPRDTRDRAHRTDSSAMNGTMSFLELSKLMNASWKSCDGYAKTVFAELAEEGRKVYRTRIEEYHRLSKKVTQKKPSPKMMTAPTALDEDVATAETMIQLTKNQGNASPPSSDVKANIRTPPSPPSAWPLHHRPVSNASSPFAAGQYEPPAHDMHARLQELEDELAAQRLRAHLRALEYRLASRKRGLEAMFLEGAQGCSPHHQVPHLPPMPSMHQGAFWSPTGVPAGAMQGPGTGWQMPPLYQEPHGTVVSRATSNEATSNDVLLKAEPIHTNKKARVN